MSSSSNGIFSPCKSMVEDEVVGSDPPGSFSKNEKEKIIELNSSMVCFQPIEMKYYQEENVSGEIV